MICYFEGLSLYVSLFNRISLQSILVGIKVYLFFCKQIRIFFHLTHHHSIFLCQAGSSQDGPLRHPEEIFCEPVLVHYNHKIMLPNRQVLQNASFHSTMVFHPTKQKFCKQDKILTLRAILLIHQLDSPQNHFPNDWRLTPNHP